MAMSTGCGWALACPQYRQRRMPWPWANSQMVPSGPDRVALVPGRVLLVGSGGEREFEQFAGEGLRCERSRGRWCICPGPGRGGARAHGLRDKFEAGQIADDGQDMGGVGALGGALADQSGLLQAGQGEIEEAVCPATLQQAVAEVAEHDVVESGVAEIEAESALEVDAAAHGLGGIAFGRVQ
jgi:hypothetical protein